VGPPLAAARLGELLGARGFTFYSGVPCSHLTPLINFASGHCDYVIAANEGDAVAVCAGAQLGGRGAVVLLQNSGLTNALSPLTSLNHTFRIPVLGFVSLRGEPGVPDEPQHELMGRSTGTLLDAIEIPWEYLSAADGELEAQLERAAEIMADGRSFFFVVRKGALAPEPLNAVAAAATGTTPAAGAFDGATAAPSRNSVLQHLAEHRDATTALLATTGYTGRELALLDDAPGNFYMVGSMGCVSSLALGLALTRPDRKVIAIDGDGAALMRMGALATIGHYRPANLLHIVLDNGCYESTGGQASVSPGIDLAGVAAACRYPRSRRCSDLGSFARELAKWHTAPTLTFLHVAIARGTPTGLGRPERAPIEVAQRLRDWLES